MRLKLIAWTALLLLPVFQKRVSPGVPPTPAAEKNSLTWIKSTTAKENHSTDSKTLDTAALKQSAWYQQALSSIAASEYQIKAATEPGTYTAPNRQQNLRAVYSPALFSLQPRKDSLDQWNLQLSTTGIYSNQELLFTPDTEAAASLSGDTVRFNHRDQFITEYINNEQGIRQNFIIPEKPAGADYALSVHLQANEGWVPKKMQNTEIQFARLEATGLKTKLTYNQLQVWDARHKALPASFEVTDNQVRIEVDTRDAVYPVTIDPLSTTPNNIIYSQQANAQGGYAVSSAGDLNGDGYSDILVGARSYDGGQTDEGAVIVLLGSPTGPATFLVRLESNQAGAFFGSSVSTAGDLNGDGYSDIVVGAPLYSNGEATEGAAYVFQGTAAGINVTPVAILESNQVNAQMGNAVSLAGDVNGDGYSDLIVAARFFDNGQTDEGVTYIFQGSAAGINPLPAAMMESNQAGAGFGSSVASAGDVNGDGYSDVIVGDSNFDNGQTNEGAAFIYHGSAAGINTVAALMVESNQAFALLGAAVSSAGDVNGDGYSDVMAGAYLYDSGPTDDGAVFIYLGSAAGVNPVAATSLFSNQASAQFGNSIAPAGDLNGDGYSDIVIGAVNYDNGSTDEGGAFVYMGSPTGIPVTAASVLEVNQAFASFGSSVASAGDVNGDGISDLIIGASNYDFSATDEGAAFVFFGGQDGPSNTPLFLNFVTQATAYLGFGVSTAGDINGDGYSDVLISAFLYDDIASNEGRVFLFYGSAAGLPTLPSMILSEAKQANAYFGYSVGSAGDINGDGYGDFIIGAFGYNGIGRAFIYYGSPAGVTAIPGQLLDGTQVGESFGVSVSTAGDVNHDGFSDVVVGAYTYDDGANVDEGRALVYHGSAAGLITAPAAILNDANKAFARFGYSVAAAGDINGDGVSDLVISAYTYVSTNTNQGAVFIYYGTCSGISPLAGLKLYGTPQNDAMFGISVAGAGDVNGDGYNDIVVGEFGYGPAKGRGYVYYGGAAGLNPTPTVLDDTAPGNANGDRMGHSVGSAGDINGDGYSDIIIGVPEYNNPFSGPPQGRAFVYLGKASGINTIPDIILTDNAVKSFFGLGVASAGDINGDGYGDLVIGATGGSWGGPGYAYIFYGNNKGGLRNNLRLYNSNLASLMTQPNITDINQFGAGLFAKSFLGRQKGKITWQTISNGAAFSGNPLANSTQFTAQQFANTDLGLNGVELKTVISKTSLLGNTHIRSRVKYDPVTALTGQVYGPWRYPEGFARGNRAMPSLAMNKGSFKLGNDTTGCFDATFSINATTGGATSYIWQDGFTGPVYTVTASGLYWVDVLIGGCIYRDSILVSGTFAKNDTLNATICAGQTYTTPKGKLLTASGIYRDTLKSVIGCDSIRYLINLTVQSLTTQTTTVNLCPSQSYTLPWGTVVTTAGTYRDTLRYAITHCDSLYRIVTIISPTAITQTTIATICGSQTYTLPWGTIVSATGTYRDTLRYTGGCDSIIRIVNLTVQAATTQTQDVKTCLGQTYTLPWGTIVNTSGTYRDTLHFSVSNCDSIYRIVNLTVQAASTQSQDVKTCLGQNYTLPWGTIVNTSGTYRDTLRYSITNCDSIIRIVNLVVQAPVTQNFNAGICAGQTYTLPWGTVVNTSGIYRDTLRYSVTNCDSIYRIVNLTVAVLQTQTVNAVTCAGQAYTLPWGQSVTTAGTYRDTLRYSGGCDSIYRIVNLTVQAASTQSQDVKTCLGQNYTLPWGAIVNTSGTYRDTLRYSITNCDSIIRIVNLVVQAPVTQNFNAGICAGQTYTLPWGTVVNTSGIYRDTLRYSVTNCDSIYRIVNLTVAVLQTQTVNAVTCAGQAYTLPWGQSVTTAGTYRDTLRYTGGCDSIYRIVNLTVQAPATATLNPKICAGQAYTLPWGTIVNTAGTYRDTLRYTTGCDSIYRIVNLVVQTATQQVSNPVVCSGQSYTMPWGTVVNASGTYRDTLRYTTGCDSIYRIVNLTVQTVQIQQPVTAIVCAGQSYTLPWGAVVNSPGTYRDTLRYTTGCDSIQRSVILTVQAPSTATNTVSICQGSSYTLPWGMVVNSSGTYRDTLHYSNTGCDSLYRIVNLNVTAAAVSAASASICVGDTYTLPWGTVVSAAGIYRDTVRTALGCDSLVRSVTLSITPKPTVTVTKSNDINCTFGIAKLVASGGVSYAWTPSSGLSNPSINNPVASPPVTTTYIVAVTNTAGCVSRDTITVAVTKDGSGKGFQVPNSFTPNNDGKNDCFGVRHWGNVTNLKFQVYNRWGQVVFSTTDPSKCWDGTFKGELQATATFVYQISAQTNCGFVNRTGTVTLVR